MQSTRTQRFLFLVPKMGHTKAFCCCGGAIDMPTLNYVSVRIRIESETTRQKGFWR
jgi:hypothetical protein